MNIAIYYDDSGSQRMNLTNPEEGNPGVGGTQFCFLMLMNYLSKRMDKHDKLFVYHSNDNGNIYAEFLNVTYVPIEFLMSQLEADNIDIALINSTRLPVLNENIKNSKTKFVVWVHNFLNLNLLKLINQNLNIHRVVFVGKEQYDRYIDDPIIYKSCCIVNMFNADVTSYFRKLDLNFPIVTYTGAIVKGKGLHALAKEWKYIVSRIPKAQLYIIGGGNLYNPNAKMGKYGIASSEYEEEFMPYLTDEKGEVLNSVHFCGILGKEKIEIYNKTTLGVINPTARTEICPLSAIEMEACGIPVISRNKNGMPDVIDNGQTGLLFNTEEEFRQSVVELLTDKAKNEHLGNRAKSYIAKKFSPDTLVEVWYDVFKDVYNDKLPIYNAPVANYTNNWKYLRVANRLAKKIIPFLPSIARIECEISKRISG
ncbi:glycosyltransferase family 4 protein [Parabacteroides sp.]